MQLNNLLFLLFQVPDVSDGIILNAGDLVDTNNTLSLVSSATLQPTDQDSSVHIDIVYQDDK